jgi:hypothetical protein
MKMPKNFELKFNEKTYVLKNLNPSRKADLIKNILMPMELAKGMENVSARLAEVAEATIRIPTLIWDFLRDEQKQAIGTFESFTDELDDNICAEFLIWAMQAIKESNDFLANGVAKVVGEQ